MPRRSLLRRLALGLALSAVPVASLLYVLGGEYYSDTDYYWHIALGHRILQTGTVGGVLVQGGRLGTGRGRTVVALPFRPDQPLPDAELLRRCQPMEMDGQTWLTLELPSGT